MTDEQNETIVLEDIYAKHLQHVVGDLSKVDEDGVVFDARNIDIVSCVAKTLEEMTEHFSMGRRVIASPHTIATLCTHIITSTAGPLSPMLPFQFVEIINLIREYTMRGFFESLKGAGMAP